MSTPARRSVRSVVAVTRLPLALLASCHPAPAAAVTVFAGILGATAGADAATCTLLAGAVLAGQLSIGWSNDRIDAHRDALIGRADKPVARAAVPRRVIDTAIAASLVTAVVLSLRLGWPAGLAHLAAVTCGWAYNLGFKATAWSWLPYAFAFGSLPAIATLALADPRVAGWWALTAGAALGVAAHLANVLPDIDADLRTGIRGAPHRIGAPASVIGAAALLVIATSLITIASPNGRRPLDWIELVLVALIVAAALPNRLRHPTSRSSFFAIMGLAALNVVLLGLNGSYLR